VAWLARWGCYLGEARRVARPLPRLLARGRAICACGERCYDGHHAWPPPHTWLGGCVAGWGPGPSSVHFRVLGVWFEKCESYKYFCKLLVLD
jgi:hypothetical protein